MAFVGSSNVLFVAVLWIFLSDKFLGITADGFSAVTGIGFEGVANSEGLVDGVSASSTRSVIEPGTVKVRQTEVRDGEEEERAPVLQSDMSSEGWSLEFVSKSRNDAHDEKEIDANSNMIQGFWQPWRRQRNQSRIGDDLYQVLRAAESILALSSKMLRLNRLAGEVQRAQDPRLANSLSLQNILSHQRHLLNGQDPSEKDDLSKSALTKENNSTHKDGKGGVQDQTEASNATRIDPTKQNQKGKIDDNVNVHDSSSQVNNKSSELKSDVKEDPNNESSKHEPCCENMNNLKACLSGAGSQELSLRITSYKSLHVKVETPTFLTADPTEIDLSKDDTRSIQIHLVDTEVVQDVASKVSITFENGKCSIDVPTDNLGLVSHQSFFYGFPFSALRTPIVGLGILCGVFVLFLGFWSLRRWLRRGRHGDGLKYEELEMSHPSGADHKEEESNGWDEVWDDNWEDTEAARSSSRLTETLSSKGLAPRRLNKDTWDK